MLNTSNYVNQYYKLLLVTMIMMLSEDDMDIILNQIDTIGINGGEWAKNTRIENYYSPNQFALSPIQIDQSMYIKGYQKIVDFRVNFALETANIGQLNSLRNNLNNNAGLWTQEYKDIN